MNILVVCSQNERRSLTAEKIYRNDKRFVLKSAGVSPKARHTISVKDIEWADLILYMERDHLLRIKEMFPKFELPPTENLEIEDDYLFMEGDLIEALKEKIELIVPKYLEIETNRPLTS